jgi:tRNA-specific 2-thiouridylase
VVSTRTVIGLSGGVDSSVAAWLLKQQGHNLLGLFMINWRTTTGTLSGDCPWEEDLDVARLVARRLNIPLEVVDFSEQYSKSVVDYMFAEYAAGRTPNPDVLCNKEVKFNLFAHAAAERGGAQIATGHYCRKETVIIDGRETHRLLAGVDTTKDQSYFLCQLSQKQLDNVIFPIGNLMKSEVRQIATQANLITAGRKDSQGICFVGKVDLPIFLQQKLQSKEGVIVEIQGDKWTGGQVDKICRNLPLNIDIRLQTERLLVNTLAHTFLPSGSAKDLALAGWHDRCLSSE